MSWIYASQASISSPGSEASHKPLLRGSAQSLTARLTLMRSESFFVAWQAVNSPVLPSGEMSELSPEQLSQQRSEWGAFWGGSLVRTSAWRALAVVWAARDLVSSMRSAAWPGSSSLRSSSWRTYQRSAPADLTSSLENLAPWGSMFGGRLSAPTSLAPLIGERGGSSLLPTPTASDYGTGGNGERKGKQKQVISLNTMARQDLWPTPTRTDASSRDYQLQPKSKKPVLSLPGAVKIWPTPRASDFKGCGPLGSKSQKYREEKFYLDAVVQRFPTPTCTDSAAKPRPPRKKTDPASGKTTGGQKPGLLETLGSALNPDWVEGLMGYPRSWTCAGEWEKPQKGKK